MTGKEKYELIIKNNADFLLTDMQAISQVCHHNACILNGKICINATRFYQNTQTTYFYDNFGYYDYQTGIFKWQETFNHYTSTANSDLKNIYAFLDEVVVIKSEEKIIWYDVNFFREKKLYPVGIFVITERRLANLFVENDLLTSND